MKISEMIPSTTPLLSPLLRYGTFFDGSKGSRPKGSLFFNSVCAVISIFSRHLVTPIPILQGVDGVYLDYYIC